MFHVKRHTLKLVLLLCAFLINSTAYSKNNINPNLDSELVTQDRIIEDIDLDITLYFIEGNKEIDTPTKTIIKETTETLKEIGKDSYLLEGNSNIKEDSRKAERRSRRKATWLCHQFKIAGLNADMLIQGNGTNEPEIENPKFEWQNQLNSNIKITTN